MQVTGRDMDPENAEYEGDKARKAGGGGDRGRRDNRIDVDDPMAKCDPSSFPSGGLASRPVPSLLPFRAPTG